MAGPNRTFFRDIPITSFSGWSRVFEIEGILAEHDRGRFTRSAMLCDAMMRDDRISGVMDTRIGALLASPVEARPANAKRKAASIAKDLCGDDDTSGSWEKMFPSPIIRGLTKWGNLLGVSVAEIIWQTDKDKWTPRLKMWHPQFVWWNWAEQRYMLTTADAIVPLPRIEDTPQSDGKWVIWCPRGYRYGWFDALVRRLAHKYIMRGWDYRDWAGYNERHGNPIIGAVTPAQANEESKAKFVMDLANMGNESTVELPTGEVGNAYDLKLIEAKSRSWQSFQEFKNEIDSDIAIAVLGQDMTTQSKAVGIGGGAQAQVHQDVALDRRREDAALSSCLREQVLTWWTRYNNNDTELAPVVSYQVDPPEDENAEAAALKGLGDAITSLKTASDNAIDVRAILDEWGVPILSEEEIAANKEKALEEAQQQMEAQGGVPGATPPGANGGPPKPGTPPAGGNPAAVKKPAPPMAKPIVAKASASVRVPLPGPVKRYEFQGLQVAVENAAGTDRIWHDAQANETGRTRMLHDYGYLDGVMGSDGEELDVYVGRDAGAVDVHVVHQLRAPDFKAHDEDKTMLGFADAAAAKDAYLAHRNDGASAFGGMSTIPLDRFKQKLQRRTGGGKIRASMADVESAALEALVARASGASALRAPRNAAGARRAKLYSDRVADSAVKMASRALSSDLVGLKAEIDAATDFDDLKARIILCYKDMDPEPLAEIVRKANLLAHLGGRVTAIKQI